MKLEDYRYADCKRFRTPAVDLNVITEQVDKALLEAWQNQQNPQYAIQAIANNEELIKPLVDQIKSDLEYQREMEMQKTKTAAEERLKRIREERLRKSEAVKSQYADKVSEHEQKVAESEQQLSKQNVTYSASKQRLDELRARVRDRLQDIGGQEGYQKLDQIQSTLKPGYGTQPVKKHEPIGQTEGAARKKQEIIAPVKDEKGNAVYVPPSSIKTVTQTVDTSSLEGIVDAPKKPGVFKKFWRFMNTPIGELYRGKK